MELSKLNEPQREAVLHDKGPLLILAGAGSGKTRVITHRIAYLIEERGVSPYSILAITFTNKAASEMKSRVEKLLGENALNVWVSTFHSSCVRMLRRYAESIGYNQNFSIYDTDDVKSVMKQILKDLNIDNKKFKEKFFINAISAAKNDCIDADEYASNAREFNERMISRVFSEYQKRLRDSNAMDFDDLLLKTVELFDTNREAIEYYNNRFEYIMVDEYQDTNKAQFRLIKQLANHLNPETGEYEHNLCVVGDDDQSIYRFRGADIQNILSFENTFHNARVIKLEQNYRSTDKILEIANEVISNNNGRKSKRLWTEIKNGADVSYTQYNNDFEEAQAICEEIKKKTEQGEKYSAFAVLYRTNAQSRLLEERMVFMNLPYRVVGGVNFYQRKEIKDVLAYLKVLTNSADALQVARIANIPKRGIGDSTLEKIRAYAEDRRISFYDAMTEADYIPEIKRGKDKIAAFVNLIEDFKEFIDKDKHSIRELTEKILEDIDYDSYLEDYDSDAEKTEERKENIGAFIDKIVSYENEAGEEANLYDFLAEVSLVADIDSVADGEDKVLLMTLHSAKGLEFDNVYMCGMEEGLFPSSMCGDSEYEIEEERRLCYVGITRAKKTLKFTAARQRMNRGELSFNMPSRFVVHEIPRHMLSISGHAHESYLNEERRMKSLYGSARNEVTETQRFFVKKGFDNKNYENPYREIIKEREIEPASSSSLGYKVGDKVKHARFGEGTVTEIVKGKKDFEVSVEFSSGPKRMLASFAKLVKC